MDYNVKKQSVNLLWTGGWDSTFRLLDLVVTKQIPVRPHYIIDHERKSTEYELRAMETIREKLFTKYPETASLVLPTFIAHRKQIKPNEDITKKWREISAAVHLGRQYEWIALYAEELGLGDLELGLIKRPIPSAFHQLLLPELTGKGHACHLRKSSEKKAMDLFKYFCFPLMYKTKLEMERAAEDGGFLDILKYSWFCHNPRKNGKPCENCVPCKIARKSGHAHGLPKTNFIRDKYLYFVYKLPKYRLKITRKIHRIFHGEEHF